MTKEELAARVAEHVGITKAKAHEAIEAISTELCHALATEGKAVLHNFGGFKVVATAPRKGVNPRTREAVDIPAGTRVRFMPHGEAREAGATWAK